MKFNQVMQVEVDNINRKNALYKSVVQRCKSFVSNTAISATVAIALTGVSANASADNHVVDVKVIEGEVVTGFNRFLSAPVWDLGPGFGGLGFSFVCL